MNGNGRKPLRCPCCLAGGVRKQNPTGLVPQGRVRRATVVRAAGPVRRWTVLVECRRCGWRWWSASPTALEQAIKLERTAAPRRPRKADGAGAGRMTL